MKTAEVRKRFLDYFGQHDHTLVPSSSLVPDNDPSLLFTNAGMVQFKDVFLGNDQRQYKRAASSQRCVRAGGKHNDLENVGYTARHHTFFEMLGNFSFGDYFKTEACVYAWEFLTKELGLPVERLWVTVYEEDKEAERIWLDQIGIDPDRFSRIGAHDNFWSMGDTGPCGPCSEIFYDHGPEIKGGPPGSPDEDGDRYIEIWNLVFMQYDRDRDQKLIPLPKPSVDTGMGLERLAAVLQGVHNNYEIDLFRALTGSAAKILGVKDADNKALRVIADHIRSCAFLIVDGVLPGNEGRGYVLRRIIRRAIRHGHQAGGKSPFFYRLVKPLVEQMGDAFPELRAASKQIEQTLIREEEQFTETLNQGLQILEKQTAHLVGKQIPGKLVFKLYDTYGFPADLTADWAREQGLTIDQQGFEVAMNEQRERARTASNFTARDSLAVDLKEPTRFTGYTAISEESTVLRIYHNQEMVEGAESGSDVVVVLDQTPFYAESGGQVGDSGRLKSKGCVIDITDTQKIGNVIAHFGRIQMGSLGLNDKVSAEVDAEIRAETAANHSATHLMHAALKSVLGKHVQQKGSLVNADRLRFDFSHTQAMTTDEIMQIETQVNTQIRLNQKVETRLMEINDARAAGAEALFGEKYDNEVRVVGMGEYSLELCGGTHVIRTGDIGQFRIISETGVAAAVRRVEAVTGRAALQTTQVETRQLSESAQALKTQPDEVGNKIRSLQEKIKLLEREKQALQQRLAAGTGADLASQIEDIKGIKTLVANVDGADAKSIRDTIDQLRDKLGSAVIVLSAVVDNKVILVSGVSKDLSNQFHAGKLITAIAPLVDGKGGGKPTMGQGGGNNPEGINQALECARDWIKDQS